MEQKLRITSSLIIPVADLLFRFSRSGGAGGQHVNKVSTRVELLFDVAGSTRLTAKQRDQITTRLRSRIDAYGCLAVSSQESRSQWQNREHAIRKFIALLSRALKEQAPRVATKSTMGSRERRLKKKKVTSRKKEYRQKPDLE